MNIIRNSRPIIIQYSSFTTSYTLEFALQLRKNHGET